MKAVYFSVLALVLIPMVSQTGEPLAVPHITWKHLSTTTGDLPAPNSGKEQTASAVLDIDGDGVNDFAISERTQAPSVVWYRHTAEGWRRYVLEDAPLHVEAGSAVHDIDGDGDPDLVMGGDAQSNEVWWWENPRPDFQENRPWRRRMIKNFGSNKHHDQMFGDFDGDGQVELVFWNQGGHKLYLAEIPNDPRNAAAWECTEIYSWSADKEVKQRGTYPSFKAVNEHEGLSKADIDGDGKEDIVGGGRWFKHLGGTNFQANIIDAGYCFSRSAAGQLIKGGQPEVVLVVGDGVAPLMLYEWRKDTWANKVIVPEVDNGHSLSLLDFNGDGNLDIFNAEMRLNGGNPDARSVVLLGDGEGDFTPLVVSTGFGLHESKIADLDGDGDFDVLEKPYNWETPRLDLWLQQ